MKNKIIAAILAFPFGVFGLHRFYLGQRLLGVLYFVFFFFTMALSIEEDAPFVLVPALVAFIDAILLYVMPKEDFDEKYNRKKARQNHQERRKEYLLSAENTNKFQNFQYFKRRGIAAYRLHDFEEAIINFNRALDFQPDDPALHFNLACCHSNIEEEEDAFFHLEKAIEFGFDDLDKIHNHKALAYVRSLEDFDLFVENDYKVISLPLPPLESSPEDEIPGGDEPTEEEKSRSYQLLVKLKELAELRDKGILTEEEFAQQKRRLIDGG